MTRKKGVDLLLGDLYKKNRKSPSTRRSRAGIELGVESVARVYMRVYVVFLPGVVANSCL